MDRRIDFDQRQVVYSVDGRPMTTIPTGQLAKNMLGSRRAAVLTMLPPALRWMSNDGTALLWERPPFATHLTYFDRKAGYGQTSDTVSGHVIPIPWQSYLTIFEDEQLRTLRKMYMWFRPGPITKPEDELYRVWLPNIGDDSEVCVGPGAPRAYTDAIRANTRGNPPVEFAINWWNEYFWNSDFNRDIKVYKGNVPAEALEAWKADAGDKEYLEHLSGFEVADVLTWDMKPAQTATVAEAMELHPGVKSRKINTSFDLLRSFARQE